MVFRNQLVLDCKREIIYFISVMTEKKEKQNACQAKMFLHLAWKMIFTFRLTRFRASKFSALKKYLWRLA